MAAPIGHRDLGIRFRYVSVYFANVLIFHCQVCECLLQRADGDGKRFVSRNRPSQLPENVTDMSDATIVNLRHIVNDEVNDGIIGDHLTWHMSLERVPCMDIKEKRSIFTRLLLS